VSVAIIAIAVGALLVLALGVGVVWWLTRPRCSRCGERAIARYDWPGRRRAFVCVEHVAELFDELAGNRLDPASVRLTWVDGLAGSAPGWAPPGGDEREQAATSRASRLLGGRS
jgi:hypothetical protein